MARKIDGWRKTRILFGFLCLAFVNVPTMASTDYIEGDALKAFGLLNVTGRFRVGYLFDERGRDSLEMASDDSQASWEEEFYLRTESFLIHPSFLNMVIGGGPLLVQQQFNSGGVDTSNSDTLVNFESRFNFLEAKNYPFSMSMKGVKLFF